MSWCLERASTPKEYHVFVSIPRPPQGRTLSLSSMFINLLLALLALSAAASAPTHLIVLQHGLAGRVTDLRFLQESLQSLGQQDVLVHCGTCNEGCTTDGIAAGGRRLAAEVLALVAANPGLRRLSLVGNSLGGCYVRYAAAELLDEHGHSMAGGLKAHTLVTTCAPHLGVRRYLFVPLPPPVLALGRFLVGQTAEDLLLRDAAGQGGSPLLYQMSRPSSRHGRALRAFERRRLYANLKGDFMVPFGTAAIETGRWGAGIRDEQLASDFYSTGRAGIDFVDRRVCDGDEDGIAVVCEVPAEHARGDELADATPPDDATLEEAMRRGLSACSWSKVAVSFRGATTASPLAHNRLPALRREGWRRPLQWVEQPQLGDPIMTHAARYILQLE